MRKAILGWSLIGLAWATAASPVVLETASFRYSISDDGRSLSFIDRATGTNCLRGGEATRCALIRLGGETYQVTALDFAHDQLTLRFGQKGVEVVLRTETTPNFVRFKVESVTGGEVDALTFVNVPLTLQGRPGESFGACALSLNLFNEYIDMCWSWIINPLAAKDYFKKHLVTAPANNLFPFGGDYIPVEPVLGHAILVRRGIAQALSELVDEGWLSLPDALELVELILNGNARRTFRLPEKLQALKTATWIK